MSTARAQRPGFPGAPDDRPRRPPPAHVQYQLWLQRQNIEGGIHAGEALQPPTGGAGELYGGVTPQPVVIAGPRGGEFLQQSVSANQTYRLFAGKYTRRYLFVQNKSNAVLYLGFGLVPNADSGIELAANGGWYESDATWCPTNDVWFYGTGTGRVVGLEG